MTSPCLLYVQTQFISQLLHKRCPAAINHLCLKISIYYKTKLFFFESFPFGVSFLRSTSRFEGERSSEGEIDWYAGAASYVILKEEKPDPPRAPLMPNHIQSLIAPNARGSFLAL